MITDVQLIDPIARGFHYAFQVRVTDVEPAFPLGCELKAEVRTHLKAATVAGTLTTAAGTLIRLDDDTVELRMTGSITARLDNSSAVLDLVRTDLTPDAWLGVQVVLPVVQPVTAPDAGA